MKRIFVVLLMVLLLFSFISCASDTEVPDEEEPVHTHIWEKKLIKEATCTEEGEYEYTCSCGEKKTEKIARLAHSFEEGSNKCTSCGHIFYSTLKSFNENATLENAKGVNEITLAEQNFDQITYEEHSSGYTGKGLLIGGRDLNHYGATPAGEGEYTFIFKDGTVNSTANGYTSIDDTNGTAVYMLLPGKSDVVFENVTFNYVVSFGIQIYTSPWSYLRSVTFKNCTFNGIIIGTSPAENVTFEGCTFKNYINASGANNSNPIWMRPGMGSWSGDHTRYAVSMKNVVFKNNTVESSRPVKFEWIGMNCSTIGYMPTLTILDNTFNTSYENSADEEGKDKHIAIYLGQKDDKSFFTLYDDGNTATEDKPIYTGVYHSVPGTKILDRNGNEKTITAREWKSETNTYTMASVPEIEE